MKKPDLWMPFYVGDYLADTLHLGVAEHGAYMLLLCHGWMNEGRIPAEEEELANISHLGAEGWKKSGKKLLKFFKVEGDHLVQKRQVAELAKARAAQDSLRAKGKMGADKRWHKDSPANAPANARANSQANAPANSPGNACATAQAMPADAPPPSPSPSQPPVPEQQPTAPVAAVLVQDRAETKREPVGERLAPCLLGRGVAYFGSMVAARTHLGAAVAMVGEDWAFAWLLAADEDRVAKKIDTNPLQYYRGLLKNGEPPDKYMSEAKKLLRPHKAPAKDTGPVPVGAVKGEDHA